MRLPKPGTKVDELTCKICKMKAADQFDEIEKCEHKYCPFKHVATVKETDSGTEVKVLNK